MGQEHITKDYINQLFQETSNWGRWGSDDEKGTLNLITENQKKAAAKLVKDGVSISLAFDLDKSQGPLNPTPMKHDLQIVEFAGDTWAVDSYSINYHGYAFSHIDALCHLIYQDKMYNGYSKQQLESTGSKKLGIQNMKEGIFSRGVLVDIPEMKGVPYLEPETAILAEDLEAWEKKTGISIGVGDVLLIRTGRHARESAMGPWNYTESAAGLHPSVVKWLRDRDVAVLGSDGASERYPSGLQQSQSPIHFLVIYGLGMPILDNLDLESLARYARAHNRYEFLFIAAPLRVEGGTGSPLNPIATF
ncbi:MAG: cyclase [Cyclobacteriaceae bacterium]|nr:MAG: cyclase [Cyclobacteriaceae bacterium]